MVWGFVSKCAIPEMEELTMCSNGKLVRLELFVKSFIQDAKSDLLIILDACHGGAARKAFWKLKEDPIYAPHFMNRNIQLLAATNGPTLINRGTTPAYGDFGFTRILLKVLRNSVLEGTFGNTDEVKGEICHTYDTLRLGNDVSSAILSKRHEGATITIRPNYNRIYR